MNRLIIIGNGFDLAHGLKTRYSDFMLDYLKGFLADIQEGGEYEKNTVIKNDGFIQLYVYLEVYRLELPKVEKDDTFQSMVFKLRRERIRLKSDLEFLDRLLVGFCVQNWVDVENEYFQSLKRFIQENRKDLVVVLNKSFEFLKNKFIEYLLEIEIKVNKNDNAFRALNALIYKIIKSEDDWNFNSRVISGNVLMLNFNYTNTVDVYFHEQHNLGAFAEEIKIHGDLKDVTNPIIFGYGDDHHEDYLQIERANERDYLVNMKHMHYSRTNNYEVLLNFLETGNLPKRENKFKSIENFQVLVLGHSCGLSDRTMLKTIFEHPNCKEIHLAYHGDTEDHFYKTIEVSRHFSDKAEMRKKLKSINKYLKMPQFQPAKD